MPYSPGVTDQSGLILSQGISQFGDAIGRGLKRRKAREQEIKEGSDILKTLNKLYGDEFEAKGIDLSQVNPANAKQVAGLFFKYAEYGLQKDQEERQAKVQEAQIANYEAQRQEMERKAKREETNAAALRNITADVWSPDVPMLERYLAGGGTDESVALSMLRAKGKEQFIPSIYTDPETGAKFAITSKGGAQYLPEKKAKTDPLQGTAREIQSVMELYGISREEAEKKWKEFKIMEANIRDPAMSSMRGAMGGSSSTTRPRNNGRGFTY